MHNKFKRIDGIFAAAAAAVATLSYALWYFCASETITLLAKKILVTKSNQNKIALLMGVRLLIELKGVAEVERESYFWMQYCCCLFGVFLYQSVVL